MTYLLDHDPLSDAELHTGGHNFARFKRAITEHSQSSAWHDVKREWRFAAIDPLPEGVFETCLCGHHPISEVCVIRNVLNGTRLRIGNVCVNHFLGIPSGKYAAALKRLRADIEHGPSESLLDFALDEQVIDADDYLFSLHTHRRRKASLTEAEMARRVEINRRIVARMCAAEEARSELNRAF